MVFDDRISMRLRISFLFFSFFALILTAGKAQEMILVVERCKALSQTSPIHNIWVDEDNIKWVANKEGLFKVMALDLVQKVPVSAGMTSLLTIRGGNAQIEWNTAEMQAVMGGATITSASYDPKTKSLWIGTQNKGAFQINASPLRILNTFSVENKKLTSNQINDIFVDTRGTVWIATDDGMLSGNGDKWTLQERYLNFIAVDAFGSNMWIMGDNFLWQVDSRGKWKPIAIEPRNVEGQLRDIAVDEKGRVWIASNMMTGYNVEMNRYQRFGPGQYFTSQFVNCLDVDKDGSIWTGTDDKGLYLIQWEDAMTVNILMNQPPDCQSAQPGASLTAKISGGTPPFQIAWNSGQTTEVITQVPPGVYEITVTDSKGVVKTKSYEIPNPGIEISVEVLAQATGAVPGDGKAKVFVNGGSGNFVYKWDNGESKEVAEKLNPGSHSITVSDETGCSATTSFTITENIPPLVVKINALKEIRCGSDANGELEAVITGGKMPYTIQWNGDSRTESKIAALLPGTYTVAVTDAAGQSGTATIELKAPPPLSTSIEALKPATANATDGQAQVKATGGTPPYRYMWSSGETPDLVKNLRSGHHTVTVTDANGCTAVASLDLEEFIEGIQVTLQQSGSIKCAGETNVAIEVNVSGGKSPFKYNWSSGGTEAKKTGLGAGEQTVTVTDAAGTVVVKSAIVASPVPIEVSVIQNAASMINQSNGKATVEGTGGTGNLKYEWDNGEKSAQATKLDPGMHTVTVTDANGCTATGSVQIDERVTELQVTVQQTREILCAGKLEGTLTTTVSGGKPPFNFQWNTGASGENLSNLGDGLYTITVTDAAGQSATTVITLKEPQRIGLEIKLESAASLNGSDGKATASAIGGTGKLSYAWDNGEKTATAAKLNAGLHTITVTDENGCTHTGEIMVTENISALVVSVDALNTVKCAGQKDASLQASVKGGKPPYQYSWSTGATTATLSNLGPGQYGVTITDAADQTGEMSFTLDAPPPLTANVINIRPATNDRIKDGKATVEIKGGTGTYSTQWNSGEITAQAVKLPLGSGNVVVTDANGCSASASFTVPEKVLPELTADRLSSGEPIRMEKIQFEADSTRLMEDAIPSLDELWGFLYDNPTIIIEVSGHTNGLPEHDYCDRISAARAKTVADYLINKGIEERRVISVGHGKRKPIASNMTPEGRKRNQRVEIRLIRIEE